MEYQKALLKRLLKMIEENENERIEYSRIMKKLPLYFWKDYKERERYDKVYNELSENEKRAYHNYGKRHSRTAIQRVRIELNKAMIEWEKGAE